jgi:cytochrome c1
VGVVDRAGEKKVRTVVKTGAPDATPPMPPQPDLTDADLDDLIAYLRAQN